MCKTTNHKVLFDGSHLLFVKSFLTWLSVVINRMDQQRMRRGCAKNVETNDTHSLHTVDWMRAWANWNNMFRVLF